MTSGGTVLWKQIRKMLKRCAPGFTDKVKKHRRWVYYEGKKHTLPLGRHGSGDRAEIEKGALKNLIRHLKIDWDCAKSMLGIL